MTVDIEALNTLLDNYDDALNRTLIERDLEKSQGLTDYHKYFGELELFVRANPIFEYQKYLREDRSNHIAYFYSDSLRDAKQRAYDSYARRMAHYDRMR